MQSDHHMHRMESRPVPRFEIVLNDRLLAERREQLREDPDRDWEDPHPWHLRHIAGNGEQVLSSQRYVQPQSAITAICSVLEAFDLVVVVVTYDVPMRTEFGHVADVSANGVTVPVVSRVVEGDA